jgi:hypothetical protein
MRCLSPDEVAAMFGPIGFRVLPGNSYRQNLSLDESLAGRQRHIGARPPPGIDILPPFVWALNRWLSDAGDRLLWVDHREVGPFGFEGYILTAARRGLGEQRPLREAPGYYFGEQQWTQDDPLEISPEHARVLGLLVGVVATTMLTASDGWLISGSGSDRIEFWEGNLFFHSDNHRRLRGAEAILAAFDCPRELK